MKNIIIIDNSKKSLSARRVDGFMSAMKTYDDIHPDRKIEISLVHYNDIEKFRPLVTDADGYILSGSNYKLTNFYTTEKIRTFRDEIDIILNTKKPVLGICFGHELMAVAYGFHVVTGEPERGVMELMFSEPFPLLPSRKNVIVDMQHVKQIEKTSRFDVLFDTYLSSNGTSVVAFKHKTKPQYGVQFHPESLDYQTAKDGRAILHAFFDICVTKDI
jgi:GMP synthase-like glutamine amidotransferase